MLDAVLSLWVIQSIFEMYLFWMISSSWESHSLHTSSQIWSRVYPIFSRKLMIFYHNHFRQHHQTNYIFLLSANAFMILSFFSLQWQQSTPFYATDLWVDLLSSICLYNHAHISQAFITMNSYIDPITRKYLLFLPHIVSVFHWKNLSTLTEPE